MIVYPFLTKLPKHKILFSHKENIHQFVFKVLLQEFLDNKIIICNNEIVLLTHSDGKIDLKVISLKYKTLQHN